MQNNNIGIIIFITLCILTILGSLFLFTHYSLLKDLGFTLVFASLLLIVCIVLYVYMGNTSSGHPSATKYSCTAGGMCVQDSNGQYTSHDDCVKNCKPPSPATKYSCTAGGTCVQDSNGQYSSHDDCVKNCKSPTPATKYSCTARGTCIEDAKGQYSSQDDCLKNCKPLPQSLSVSSDTLKQKIGSNPFDAVNIYTSSKIPKTGALLNYTSIEYDPFNYPLDANSASGTILDGINKWFTSTLSQCSSGDFVIINGDFISMDTPTKTTLVNKCNAGVNVILVVDRWEVSGYPLLSSKTEKEWSPKINSNSGCISDGPCKSSSSDKYPYGCPDGSPGNGQNYCKDTNDVIIQLKGCKNFYLLDEAATKLNTQTGTSRNSPWHNHRHVSTFYLPSKNIGSVFKGSWNFTGGSDPRNSIPGQKESGFVVTADISSDIIQTDIIWNYYWLASMSVFCPASLPPPEKFTVPGNSSPIFNKMLKLVTGSNIDKDHDQLLFPKYGTPVELYSITQQNNKTYIGADANAVLSIGFAPPPGPPRDKKGLPNPTPWEGSGSTMLERTINDGSQPTKFKDAWTKLSCISNTMQFMYPYTPVYDKNPAPPDSWKVPTGSKAPNCGSATVEYFSSDASGNIGDTCSKDSDCSANGSYCNQGYCVFTGDTRCTNCQACGLAKSRPKSAVCAVGGENWPQKQPPALPGCYSMPASGCEPDSSGNITCSAECPCYTCSEPPANCTVVTDPSDVSGVCFLKDQDGNPIPSNKCYKLNGKNYDCAARVPWGPGGLWLGGLLYKFWKEAGDNSDNKSVYVSMYSSFDDAGEGCIFNCGTGNTGGNSAWGSDTITSSQYNYPGVNSIDSVYWYSKADPNSIQNVVDFLTKNGSVYLLRGQWAKLSTDTGGAFRKFKDVGKDRYNAKLFLAQQKQITKNGGNGTATTKVGSDGNPLSNINSQRNHTKVYISKDSIASCSGHPYNGSMQDWGGINEILLVEKCPNACKPVRSNWEQEFKYGEELVNASTFPWASAWSQEPNANNPAATKLTNVSWSSGSKTGGLVQI